MRSVALDDAEQGLAPQILDWAEVEPWEAGERFRSVMAWRIGMGRVVSIRPGHETLPVWKDERMLRLLENAIRWRVDDAAVKQGENVQGAVGADPDVGRDDEVGNGVLHAQRRAGAADEEGVLVGVVADVEVVAGSRERDRAAGDDGELVA